MRKYYQSKITKTQKVLFIFKEKQICLTFFSKMEKAKLDFVNVYWGTFKEKCQI